MVDKENKLIVDWLAFTIHDITLDDIVSLLGFEKIIGDFENGRGSNGYLDRLYYDCVSIHYNGRIDMGIHVNMSGQGCRVFETYSSYGQFDELLLRIMQHENYNITRLDIAYDDFVGVLPIDEIVHSVHFQKWLSPSNMKWWKAVYSFDGISSYIGSPRSNIRFRFYDKGAEKKVDYQWTRLEIQMRDIVAVMFALNWMSGDYDLNTLFFGTINKYVRFIELDNVRKTRCSTSEWWDKFLETKEVVKLHLPGTEYNLTNLKNMVISKAGYSIHVYLSLFGVNKLIEELIRDRPIKDAPKKYKNLMNNYIDDYEANHTRSHLENVNGDLVEVFEEYLPKKLKDIRDELIN